MRIKIKENEMDKPQHNETFQADNCFTECAFSIISIHSFLKKYKQQLNRKTSTKYNVHRTASFDGRQVKWLVYVILCVDKDCQVWVALGGGEGLPTSGIWKITYPLLY